MEQAAHSHSITPLPPHYLPGTGEIAQVHARLVAAEQALAEVRALVEHPEPFLDPELRIDLAVAERSLQVARRTVEVEMALLGRQKELPLMGGRVQ